MPFEQWLTIGVVLCFLGFDMVACWMLATGRVDTVRIMFARWACRWHKDHRVESYIEGLRKLAE